MTWDVTDSQSGVAVAGLTDFTYTGQQVDAQTGLMFYNARWYDPALGRFVSADTIVPNPGNPQDLNRYAYVRNSPVKYIDPSGYFLQCTSDGRCYDDGYSISNPGFISYDADERRNALKEYNNLLYGWARNEWITDLEAFAQLCDYAASMIPTDIKGNRTETFVYDVGAVVTTQVTGDKYYGNPLQQTEFDWVFQDPGAGGNQPHHFWFYVYQVMTGGRVWGSLGNLAHETFLARYDSAAGGLVGRSYQDFALGQEGVNLGADLKMGRMQIEDVGNYIRANFGPGGGLVSRWSGSSWGAEFNKKLYALCLAVPGATFFPIGEGQQGRR